MDIEEDATNFARSNLHGPKVHVWGAISSRGKISLEIFTNNMTGESYTNILKKKSPEMHMMYPEGFIFMHDNDPKHTSHVAGDYIKNNFDEVLGWPSYSPDINPIELIWSWLKRKVSMDVPKNVTELKSSIRRHWNSLTPVMIQKYIRELENRYEWIVSNNGRDYTK